MVDVTFDDSDKFVIDSLGSVGIGTTNPLGSIDARFSKVKFMIPPLVDNTTDVFFTTEALAQDNTNPDVTEKQSITPDFNSGVFYINSGVGQASLVPIQTPEGAMIYDTTAHEMQYWNGTDWQSM